MPPDPAAALDRLAGVARDVLARACVADVAVDQHTGFDVAADTTDGVHPNEAGESAPTISSPTRVGCNAVRLVITMNTPWHSSFAYLLDFGVNAIG